MPLAGMRGTRDSSTVVIVIVVCAVLLRWLVGGADRSFQWRIFSDNQARRQSFKILKFDSFVDSFYKRVVEKIAKEATFRIFLREYDT